MGKVLLLATTAGVVASDDPFWGCGLLGPIPGIASDGSVSGDTTKLLQGLKAANSYDKVSYWNWNLAPQQGDDGSYEYLSEDFLFMPEQWGTDPVNDAWVVEAGSVGFTDTTGNRCPAQMADIFLGANEPDIIGSCMGDMMGACTAPCTDAEAQAGDCPVCHLLAPQGSATPNENGHCDCYSHSHATGSGFWQVTGVDKIADPQPLPNCWSNPQCVAAQMSMWKETAATVVAKGYRYLSTPLVAVNLDWVDSFITHACADCQDISCGCPTHIGWHFYGNDCLSAGDSGYDGFQDKLDKTVALMEKWPFLKGAIVNEVGMLNCAMDTPDAICIPNGPGQMYPALNQPNHACPSTPELPNGLATFIEELLRRVSQALTSDGRRAVASFSWFNEDMAGGTYNLQLFNDDGSLNDLGEAYISSCQAWANAGPMPPAPTPHPPVPTPPPQSASCDAHPACSGLQGDCCPTGDGVMLGCCGSSPTPPPPPPPPTPSPSCDANPACQSLGLAGDCCPTSAGVMLGCCATLSEVVSLSEVVGEQPYMPPDCAIHPACARVGLTGDCCPTSGDVMLDCCYHSYAHDEVV